MVDTAAAARLGVPDDLYTLHLGHVGWRQEVFTLRGQVDLLSRALLHEADARGFGKVRRRAPAQRINDFLSSAHGLIPPGGWHRTTPGGCQGADNPFQLRLDEQITLGQGHYPATLVLVFTTTFPAHYRGEGLAAKPVD